VPLWRYHVRPFRDPFFFSFLIAFRPVLVVRSFALIANKSIFLINQKFYIFTRKVVGYKSYKFLNLSYNIEKKKKRL